MGGILSTIHSLISGDGRDAKSTNFDQPQTNHGNIGTAVTHGDQSGSSSADYASGFPVHAGPVNKQGGHGGHNYGGGGYAGTGGPGEGHVTINHYSAEQKPVNAS